MQATDRGEEVKTLLQPIHDGIADGDCPEHRATARQIKLDNQEFRFWRQEIWTEELTINPSVPCR